MNTVHLADTPVQGNQLDMKNPERFSTSSPFSPKAQFASTPMVKVIKDRKTERPPVFGREAKLKVRV